MPRITRAREVVLVVIGVFTPVGILAVNASAFVMQHLAELRVMLAVAALVSSLLLNGLVAISAVRYAQRNAPLLYTEYRRAAWVAAVLVVGLVSFVAAYFTYLGLEDPSRLPDRTSILASLWALLTPFVITYADRRFLRRREVAAEKEEERERGGRRPSAGSRPSPRRF